MFMKRGNRFVPAHYLRILLCFWKNSLIREMSFRAHFFIKVVGELAWVVMTLIFLDVIFRHTRYISGWSHPQYLFLMGTHLLITGIFEAFFFDNCCESANWSARATSTSSCSARPMRSFC